MQFQRLTTSESVEQLIRWHNAHSKYVILDVETTGLNPLTDTIDSIILSGQVPDSSYLFNGAFAGLLHELTKPLVCHNFKFDFHFLFRCGVDLRRSGLHADTMLLDHLLDENQEHSLDSIVTRRYNDPYKKTFWENNKTFNDASEHAQLEYACKDVIYTGRAYRDITHDLTVSGIPDSLIQHVHQLALELYATEVTGLKLDLPYLEAMGQKLSSRIKTLKTEMRTQVDMSCSIIENTEYLKELDKRKTDRGRENVKRPEFNFDSSQQLATLLYDRLKLPVQVNKKTRKRTVDDAALERLEPHHPLISGLREYRGHQKIYGSFIVGSLDKMHAGRVYPSFNVNGTVTGRLSASNPNLQQLPTEGGVRGIYVPDPGHRFITCDYSQLEVSLAAHFSQDRNLLRIGLEGDSQHDITARGLGISRSAAKTINFALQYGAGVKKIQEILGCSAKEAEQALTRYWETYAGLRDFVRNCHERVERGEALVNPFGRRRRFPAFTGLTHWEKEHIKRQAPNSLIQGTGADCTNRAYYLISQHMRAHGLGMALFPIHDEVLIMPKENACEEAANNLISIMQGISKEIGLTVPLNVSCSKPMIRWSKE